MVLAVISVVLSVCAPTLRGFFLSRQTADSAAVMLSLTKWARSEAISHGTTVRLNIDAKEGTFWLTRQEGGRFVDLEIDMGRTFEVPQDSTIAWKTPMPGAPPQGPVYVQFYPSGRSDVGTVEITGRGDEKYRITCDAASESFRLILPTEEAGS